MFDEDEAELFTNLTAERETPDAIAARIGAPPDEIAARLEEMTLEERTFNFGDDFIREMYDQSEQAALMKIRKYDEEHPEG